MQKEIELNEEIRKNFLKGKNYEILTKSYLEEELMNALSITELT